MHWKADDTQPGKRLDKQLESAATDQELRQIVVAFTAQAKQQDS